jgi:hypothetical protein
LSNNNTGRGTYLTQSFRQTEHTLDHILHFAPLIPSGRDREGQPLDRIFELGDCASSFRAEPAFSHVAQFLEACLENSWWTLCSEAFTF